MARRNSCSAVAASNEPQKTGKGEGIVRLGGVRIEFHCLAGRRQSARKRFLRKHGTVLAKQIVGVSQSDIRCGISGIMHDRLGKEIHGLVEIVRSTFLEVIAALQVEILSFDAGHVRSGKSILEARARGDRKRKPGKSRRSAPMVQAIERVWLQPLLQLAGRHGIKCGIGNGRMDG